MAKLSTTELLDAFKELSLIELSEFIKEFETTFGVTAAAPVAAAAAAPAAAGGDAGAAEEEASDEVDVILEAAGEKKIQVIKEVRSLTSLGLKEAKDLVEAAPKPVLEKVNKEAADKAREALEAAGATVSYRVAGNGDQLTGGQPDTHDIQRELNPGEIFGEDPEPLRHLHIGRCGGATRERRRSTLLQQTARTDITGAGEILGRSEQGGSCSGLVGLCEEPVADSHHPVLHAILAVELKICSRVAGMCRESSDRRAGCGQPTLELEGEQQVGQLRLLVPGQARYVRFCQLRSSSEIEPPRCAPEATVTTRSVTCGSSRLVSAKWPRWLVPICNSKPSTVRLSGVLITPALLINMLSSPCQLSAKARTEARSARSSRRTSQSPGTDSAAAAPLARSRTAKTTRAPASASARAVGSPIPLLAPVTTTMRPRCGGRSAEVHPVEAMILNVAITRDKSGHVRPDLV